MLSTLPEIRTLIWQILNPKLASRYKPWSCERGSVRYGASLQILKVEIGADTQHGPHSFQLVLHAVEWDAGFLYGFAFLVFRVSNDHSESFVAQCVDDLLLTSCKQPRSAETDSHSLCG